MAKDVDIPYNAWTKLLEAMGLALHQWAEVEESLFTLFSKLLRSPSVEIDAAVFYCSPSFESKKRLTDQIAELVLTDTEKSTWRNLRKRLEKGAEFRGKIAHYGIGFDIVNITEIIKAESEGVEAPKPKIGEIYLRRAKRNQLKKGSSAKTETNEILEQVAEFGSLLAEIDSFIAVVEANYPHPDPAVSNPILAYVLGKQP